VKKVVLITVVIAFVAVLGVAKSLDTGYEPEGLDELTKQKGIFKTTLLRPGADFSRYTKLNPRQVALVIRDPGQQELSQPTGRLIGSRNRGGVLPGWEEITELKKILDETIVNELDAKTGFEVVDDSGPGTLVLQATVTDAVFDETTKIKTADGEPALVLSQGTIVFDLIDGETGVIQARLGERRKCRPSKDASSVESTGPWPCAGAWTEDAVTDLCQELKRVQGGAAPKSS
jgi:hypothetical protein